MAGDGATGAEIGEHGIDRLAFVHRLRAARMEAAAGGGLQRARHFALDDGARAARLASGRRPGRRQQGLGIGVQRALVELVPVGDLDNSAEIHDGDAVGDMAHHGKVVGDEDEVRPSRSCSS